MVSEDKRHATTAFSDVKVSSKGKESMIGVLEGMLYIWAIGSLDPWALGGRSKIPSLNVILFAKGPSIGVHMTFPGQQ